MYDTKSSRYYLVLYRLWLLTETDITHWLQISAGREETGDIFSRRVYCLLAVDFERLSYSRICPF